MQHVDDHLNSYHADDEEKCNLFALNLTMSVIIKFKSLLNRSINSWIDFNENLTSCLIAEKRKPTTIATLGIIAQGKKESLRSYIDCFIHVIIEVGGLYESLKCWIFENGLKDDNSFKDMLGRKEAHSLKELLNLLSRKTSRHRSI